MSKELLYQTYILMAICANDGDHEDDDTSDDGDRRRRLLHMVTDISTRHALAHSTVVANVHTHTHHAITDMGHSQNLCVIGVTLKKV